MSLSYKVKGLDKFIRSAENKGRRASSAKKGAPWDTGWLSENIYSSKASRLGYKVISPAEYSVYVELGTRKMMAQPYMEPALKEEYPKLMKNLNKIFRK